MNFQITVIETEGMPALEICKSLIGGNAKDIELARELAAAANWDVYERIQDFGSSKEWLIGSNYEDGSESLVLRRRCDNGDFGWFCREPWNGSDRAVELDGCGTLFW